VEDWERYFQEKSRRRAEKEKRRDFTATQRRMIFALLFLALVAAFLLISR
jgi:hypothetical protein